MVLSGINETLFPCYTVRIAFVGNRVSEILDFFITEKEAEQCADFYRNSIRNIVVSKEVLKVKISVVK
jgi:hypothetical protein